MKIFLLSPSNDSLLTSDQKEHLSKLGEINYVNEPGDFSEITSLYDNEDEKIIAIDPDYCNWNIPNEVLDKVKNLKAVCLQSTSFSWIDPEYAKEKGIVVTNLRGFSSIAVAEWAIMMALNVARRVPLMLKAEWRFDYFKHQGIEFEGKTAGIIGLGNIGTKIAEKCKGMGMNVKYWSKNSSDDRFEQVELEELMNTADVIFPVVAQNDETKGLITDEMLKSMKKNAIFATVVHHVYNHELLLEMAKTGDIFGYAFEENDINFNKYEGNVWAGPEMAWSTDGSLKRNSMQWVEAITNATNGDFPTRVN